MIFVGDIAVPYSKSIEIINLPSELKDKNWFGNLEGALIDNNSDNFNRQSIVFNDKKAIQKLLKDFNFKGFALANNHILDTGSLQETIDFLKSNEIAFCGIGENIRQAATPLKIRDGKSEIIILNFGWEVIQCQVTTGAGLGVNPLNKEHVLTTVKEAIKMYKDNPIVIFMHWSYELESEPQPFERELARKLIDIGVAGVIGCHPHRVGGFEIYKNKPIVYSLGNWLFKQGYYHSGKLKFPPFCNQQVAFEWDFQNNKFKFHFFEYKSNLSEITYTHTEDYKSETMTEKTPFRDFDNKAYMNWYKTNHYHKRKGLPIYYWEDGAPKVYCKNKVNKIRDILLSIYLKIVKKR